MILIIILVHMAVLWTLEFFLYPELIIYPYLTASGFLPYKNILDQHFPGLMFFPINFYTLGINSPLTFKILLVSIVAIQALLLYKIAIKIGNKAIATLSVLSYLIWQPFFEGNQLWLDIFLPLFTLPAFWSFLNSRYFMTGLFLGLGIVFKQTQVPLVAFAGLAILLQYRRKSIPHLIRYSLGALIPSAVMLMYFAKVGILNDFWYWTVKFNLSEFATSGSLAPRIVDLVRLAFPVSALVLAVFVVSRKYKIRFLIGWMIFTIVGGIARFGLLHFQPAMPYFSIIFGLLVYELFEKKKKYLLCGIIALVVLWLGYFYSRQSNLFQTKFFDNQTESIVTTISSKVQPQDKIFLLGVHPHIYELTKTYPPGKLFIFQFPWFFKIAGDRVLNSLKDDPPKLIVYDSQSQIDGQRIQEYGDFLIEYINDNYRLILKQGSIEYYENRY